MGRSYLADIPGNFFVHDLGSNASVASNGGAARLADVFFVAPANLKLLSVWRQVQVDESTHTDATASYRQITLHNGGTSGTAETGLATRNNTASTAQYGSHSFALAATPTASAGDVIWASHATVGGDLNDGTILRAAKFSIAYELL